MTNWFGGSLPAKKEGKAEEDSSSTTDWSNFFPNLAVELEPYFAMYPEYQVPPDQWQALLADQRGAAIGRKLADKYGWKVGDTFYLESFIPVHRKADGPFEFVVRAIFDTDPVKYPGTDTNLMLFSRKYLYEATGRTLQAGTYAVELDDPGPGGDGERRHRRPLRELRRPDPHRDREGLRGELRGHGREPRPPPQRDRHRGDLHHPARGGQHHEHRRARAKEGDRRPQDPRLHEPAGDGPGGGGVGPDRAHRGRARRPGQPGDPVVPHPRARHEEPGRHGRAQRAPASRPWWRRSASRTPSSSASSPASCPPTPRTARASPTC